MDFIYSFIVNPCFSLHELVS